MHTESYITDFALLLRAAGNGRREGVFSFFFWVDSIEGRDIIRITLLIIALVGNNSMQVVIFFDLPILMYISRDCIIWTFFILLFAWVRKGRGDE